MKWGTKTSIPVNKRIVSIVREAGLIGPALLVLYGIMLQARLIPDYHHVPFWLLPTIAAVWIWLGIYQYLKAPLSRAYSMGILVAYHCLTMVFILALSGFSVPMMTAWIVLLLVSYQYFSRDGLWFSATALVATVCTDSILHLSSYQSVFLNTVSCIAVILVSALIIAMSKVQTVDHKKLAKAQSDSLLQRDRVVTLINNLTDAVLATDRDGTIDLYNAASLGLLDTNTDLLGTSIDKIVHLLDSDHRPFKLSHAMKQSHSVVSRDDISATISGETIRLGVIFSPIRGTDSETGRARDGYIVMLRDITKQKSLEEERDEFISVVSHELRTPITIAEGTLSNLQLMMNRDDIPEATLKQNVDTAHEQVLFLARMVNDLSTLSRAERGVADAAEDINVSELVHDLFNEYAPQAKAKGLSFDLDLDTSLGMVSTSRLYLKELLQNFVTNAIKYTKEGGVTVKIAHTGPQLVFSVADTGIGISKSDQKRVFEKFFRSEDYRTRETGGTGLGLYVAQKLSKKLGTQIEMTSRLNHGSSFSFALQAKQPPRS